MNHNAFGKESALGLLGSLIDEINGDTIKRAAAQKKAAQKRADDEAGGSGSAKEDPGGYKGKSSHPSAKADGGLHPADVGFRSRENHEDVKEDVPANVEEAGASTGDSDYDQLQIGTKKAPTGEDPSAEDAYDGKKDDPGTSHPANAEEVGEKYSSWNFPQLYKAACGQLERVLARVANGEQIKAAAAPAAQPQQAAQGEWTKEAVDQAAAAGYRLAELASVFGTTPDDESLTKFAAAEQVVRHTITEYFDRADMVGEYLYKTAAYEEHLLKAAEGDPTGGGMEGGPGMLPPEGMPPGGGMPPPDAGGMPPPGGGGEGGPPIDPSGAPPELGGEGGMPPEHHGGGGGGGGDEEAVNEMANALIDAGIPPEKLIAALQGAAGGGEGGPEGGDPAAAPGGEKAGSSRGRQRLPVADARHLFKVANDIAGHLYNGRFRRTRPASKQAASDRHEAVQYLNYVREVLRF